MRSIINILLIISLFSSFQLYAKTYVIPRNYYPGLDHGNPNHSGSLAKAFADPYKDSFNTYILSTPATHGSYGIYTPLQLPPGSTLKSSSGGKAWIRSYANHDKLINISSSSKITGIILDGNYKVYTVVKGTSINNFTLENSEVRRTRNDNGYADVRAHLVTIQDSNNIDIINNVLRQAGDSGVDLGTRNTKASSLYLAGNTNVRVHGNNISYALSAGIDFTNSILVEITNNTIDNVGRANKYGGNYPADGITAYRNLDPYDNLHYTITGNEITNWYNNGIHLSGRYLTINNNKVHKPGINASTHAGHAIFVGDYKDTSLGNAVQCSSVITIQNNILERATSPSWLDAIRITNYKWVAYWPTNNRNLSGNLNIQIRDHRTTTLPLSPIGQSTCPIGYANY